MENLDRKDIMYENFLWEKDLLEMLDRRFKDRVYDPDPRNPLATVYSLKNPSALSLEFNKFFYIFLFRKLGISLLVPFGND